MPTLLLNSNIKVIRLSVGLSDFPDLLAKHRASDPDTQKVEKLGAAYRDQGFKEAETTEFIKAVCRWGCYDGIAGKVLKHNALSTVTGQLRAAYVALTNDSPLLAIREVTAIKGLAVSFGSKHLKFLDPDRAVVLDSIISEEMGYRRTPEGYATFLADCIAIRDILNENNIAATPQQPLWRVSDVEMAIFKSVYP